MSAQPWLPSPKPISKEALHCLIPGLEFMRRLKLGIEMAGFGRFVFSE